MIGITINYKTPVFAEPPQKQRFAEAVAKLFMNDSDFQPYRPNDADWDFWTVDQGNDWKLKFLADNAVQVRHRYSNGEAMTSLAGWLAYRTGGEVVL